MKEELQSKLVEILSAMQTTAGQAKDFALEQLPDIAQSYVLYGRVASLVGMFVGLAILALCAWAGWFIWQQNKKAKSYADEPIGLNVFGGGVLCIVAVCGVIQFLMGLSSAMLVWFAPKVWLLKEIAGLIK